MASLFRRFGARLLNVFVSSAAPATPTNSVILYALDDGNGTPQVQAKLEDARVYPITPPNSVGGLRGTCQWFDDLLNVNNSTFSANGGGTNSLVSRLGAGNPGVNRQTVTVAGVDAAFVGIGAQADQTIFFGGGEVIWVNLHAINNIPNGANNMVVRVGMHDAAGVNDVTDGVYLEVDLATNGNANYWLCAASASVRTKVDTGIAVTINKRVCQINVNAAGTLVTATIDGVASANTVAANIPTTNANHTTAGRLQAVKQLGASANTIDHDYYGYSQMTTR